MKLKLFKKFFLVNSLIIILSVTLVSVLVSIFVSNHLTNEKKDSLKNNCYAVKNIAEELKITDLKDSDNITLFRTISGVTESDVFIVDSYGKVALCSCEDWSIDGVCSHNSGYVNKEILDGLKSSDYNKLSNLHGLLPNVNFVYGTKIQISDNTIGYVFAVISPNRVKDFYVSILKVFLFSAIVPLVLMLLFEYIFSYRMIRPLKLMAKASRSMAKGDFSKRIPVTSNDEIGELAVAFNQMTNSLVQIESARRRFIADISHELKTPMTTISGFIDGILDGTIPKEKQSYYLSIVSNEIKRLSRLVESMLNLAKLESGAHKINPSKFDIFDMVFKILISQEQRIDSKKLDINGLDNTKPLIVYADYDLIYQVIYNLVDNAVKFTDEGGKIVFSIENSNDSVKFSIKNTGEGIEEKELPFVFERFYKTDKSRSDAKNSTGLGLYIANTIISIHGGKMAVKSKKNSFTEFTFVIPNSLRLTEDDNNK